MSEATDMAIDGVKRVGYASGPSKMVSPLCGAMRPAFSASDMIDRATLSFVLPPTFKNSAFARMSQPVASDSERMRNMGLLPMRPSTPSRIGYVSFPVVFLFLDLFLAYISKEEAPRRKPSNIEERSSLCDNIVFCEKRRGTKCLHALPNIDCAIHRLL